MLVDLTQPITATLPSWPGDSPVSLIQSRSVAKDRYNNHYLQTGMHSGTHIDVPLHFYDDAAPISQWPLDSFIGQGFYLDCSRPDKNGIICYDAACEKMILENSIVVCHTGWHTHFGQNSYFDDYPVLAPEYAQLFCARRIKMLCIDSPSPDKPPFAIHKQLFSRGILIAENLCGTAVLSGLPDFEIIALPLRIDAAGSIARIVAKTPD